MNSESSGDAPRRGSAASAASGDATLAALAARMPSQRSGGFIAKDQEVAEMQRRGGRATVLDEKLEALAAESDRWTHRVQAWLEAKLSKFRVDSSRYMFSEQTLPWLDEDGNVTWSRFRICLFKMTTSQRFEAKMGMVIIFNLIIIIWEADYRAQCHPNWTADQVSCPYDPDKIGWLYVVNWVLLVLYSVEACMHIIAHRCAYFHNKWNVLDFCVVCAGWFSLGAGAAMNIGFLRVFRITRLTRAFRIVLSIRELYMLLTGLASSFKAIFWGTMLLGMMLVLWSIVLVEFVHPVNASLLYDGCERCPHGFQSVTESTLTLFQTIIAGDSWGMIAVPVIEEEPTTALILVAIVLSVSLGVMNLILAVIVESAAEARDKDIEEKAKQKEKDQRSTKQELLRLCGAIDIDLSGTITLEEMKYAFANSPPFRKVMTVLEVKESDLDQIFRLMDGDKSGAVDYSEFCEQLYQLRTNDIRMMIALNKFTMGEFEKHMREYVMKNGEKTKANSLILEEHTDILRAMDDKLAQMCGKGPMESACAEKSPEKGADDAVADEPADYCTPQDVAEPCNDLGPVVEWKTFGSADVKADLGNLQQRVEELAGLSADIVKKADEQVATLQSHAKVLACVRDALPEMPQASENTALATPKLNEVSVQVGKLQRHVRERLAVLVQDMERRVDEEMGALASGGRLLEALAGGLGMPPVNLSALLETKASGGGGMLGSARAAAAAAAAGQAGVTPLPPSSWRSPRPGSARAAGRNPAAEAAVAAGLTMPQGDRSGPLCGCNGTEIPKRIVITK